ncbi:hypothetical protein CYMTET_32666 [Cymbomonas tetramitiformis]|uniref:Uncharacterized protein n=1 Tax=Cymbomonas tetramitiformis TaxID=36881 RepID=A0AAE0FEL1_9CHLO|nr:hypothetical protein CYMTET_32666 [Cymbomonas tetramitiformis]
MDVHAQFRPAPELESAEAASTAPTDDLKTPSAGDSVNTFDRPHELEHADPVLDKARAIAGKADYQGHAKESWLHAGWRRLFGAVLGMAEVLLAKYYTAVVDEAPYQSWAARSWEWIAKHLISSQMNAFYNASTDFNKRLVDVAANGKFASVTATKADIHKVERGSFFPNNDC